MIKINLVREGRAARGAAGGPTSAASAGGSNLNNVLILGLLLVFLGISGVYWFTVDQKHKKTSEELVLRRDEMQKLEKIIKEVEAFQRRKESLEKRINLINQLKANQKGPVRILDQISRDLPDLVWLDTMSLTGTNIAIAGRALNPNAVANFVENIKGDEFFDEPELSGITQGGGTPPVYSFNMSFNFTYKPAPPPAAPVEAAPEAVPPAPGATPAAPPQS